jgi:hypothetical protein
MENKKRISPTTDYMLVQRNEFDTQGKDLRSAYQVIEPDGNVAGLFGSLTEAQAFLNMLNKLNHHYE